MNECKEKYLKEVKKDGILVLKRENDILLALNENGNYEPLNAEQNAEQSMNSLIKMGAHNIEIINEKISPQDKKTFKEILHLKND